MKTKIYTIKPVEWVDESCDGDIYYTSSNCGYGTYCFTNTRQTLDELRKDISTPKEPRLWWEPFSESCSDKVIDGISNFEDAKRIADETLQKYLRYYLEEVK